MQLFTLLTTLVAATAVSAAPATNNCLTQKQANTTVTQFSNWLAQKGGHAAANATAQALLAPGYIQYSDSILSLEGLPLGKPIAPNKQVYIAASLAVPAPQNITTIEIDLVGCNKILWVWNFKGVGTAKEEVRGMNLFTLNKKGQITETLSEFNSIAWGVDTGYTVTPPTSH